MSKELIALDDLKYEKYNRCDECYYGCRTDKCSKYVNYEIVRQALEQKENYDNLFTKPVNEPFVERSSLECLDGLCRLALKGTNKGYYWLPKAFANQIEVDLKAYQQQNIIMKALTNGIYKYSIIDKEIIKCNVSARYFNDTLGYGLHIIDSVEEDVFVNDYGKTWAFTEGELKK